MPQASPCHRDVQNIPASGGGPEEAGHPGAGPRGSAFIGARNEAQMRLFAHDVTGHVFHAGHDLAEEVPDEMADVVLPFLALRT
jgi:hypothetical protein